MGLCCVARFQNKTNKTIKGCKKMEYKEMKACKKMEMIDKDHDGKLTLDEIIGGMDEQSEVDPKEIENRKNKEKARFALLDDNKDGYLSDDELLSWFYPRFHQGVLIANSESLMEQLDADKDGKLTVDEIFGTPSKSPPEHSESQILVEHESRAILFKQLDDDGDGLLDVHEVAQAGSEEFFTHSAMLPMFELADSDQDGHLSVDEIQARHKHNEIPEDVHEEFKQYVLHHEL